MAIESLVRKKYFLTSEQSVMFEFFKSIFKILSEY
jgi:hypothetical protein